MRRSVALLGAAVLSAMATQALAAGWSYEEVKDPITDAKRGIAVWTGAGGELVFKCDENGPQSMYVVIYAKKFLGALNNASRSVIMRVDDGQVTSRSWFHDGTYAAITQNGPTVAIAAEVAAAKKVAFRLTTYEGANVDVLLESDGDSSVLRQAFTTCGQSTDGLPLPPVRSARAPSPIAPAEAQESPVGPAAPNRPQRSTPIAAPKKSAVAPRAAAPAPKGGCIRIVTDPSQNNC